MLEIKNPVSRVITGEPTTEYWIQMQIQMEVCNINLCDFLETRFVEYETYETFCSDGTFTLSVDGKPKGCILLYVQDGKYVYDYQPYGSEEGACTEWETASKQVPNREFLKTIYWRLEQVSCVLVERNYGWFEEHKEYITQFWETVLTERKSGEWMKRLPVKKTPTW